MARRKTIPPLRTKGHVWGKHRVELGVSMRELQRRTGINRAQLSLMESGRMIPTSDEFDLVMAALSNQGGSQPASPEAAI